MGLEPILPVDDAFCYFWKRRRWCSIILGLDYTVFLIATKFLKSIVCESMRVCDGFLGAISQMNRFNTLSVRLSLQKRERNQKETQCERASVNWPLDARSTKSEDSSYLYAVVLDVQQTVARFLGNRIVLHETIEFRTDPLPEIDHVEHVSDAFDRGPGGTQAVVLDADVTEDGVDEVHRERGVIVSDGEVRGEWDHLCRRRRVERINLYLNFMKIFQKFLDLPLSNHKSKDSISLLCNLTKM